MAEAPKQKQPSPQKGGEFSFLQPHQLRPLLKDSAATHNYVHSLITRASQQFRQSKGEQVLPQVREAERVLELAACSGMSVKRSYICVALYNVAALYLCFFKFDVCLAYLEAFFKQFEEHLKTRALEPAPLRATEEFRLITSLQYCAVLSQHKQHRRTVALAKSVNQALLALFRAFQTPAPKGRGINLSETAGKHSNVPFSLGEMVKLARKSYRNWNFKKSSPGLYMSNDEQKYLESVSIMSLMQMAPIRPEDYERPDTNLTQRGVVLKLLYLVLSFFTLGNEIRLCAAEDEEDRLRLIEYFYLRAIDLYCSTLPVQNSFINSIIASYEKNFNSLNFEGDLSALEQITEAQKNYFARVKLVPQKQPIADPSEERAGRSESPEEPPLKSKLSSEKEREKERERDLAQKKHKLLDRLVEERQLKLKKKPNYSDRLNSFGERSTSPATVRKSISPRPKEAKKVRSRLRSADNLRKQPAATRCQQRSVSPRQKFYAFDYLRRKSSINKEKAVLNKRRGQTMASPKHGKQQPAKPKQPATSSAKTVQQMRSIGSYMSNLADGSKTTRLLQMIKRHRPKGQATRSRL